MSLDSDEIGRFRKGRYHFEIFLPSVEKTTSEIDDW